MLPAHASTISIMDSTMHIQVRVHCSLGRRPSPRFLGESLAPRLSTLCVAIHIYHVMHSTLGVTVHMPERHRTAL